MFELIDMLIVRPITNILFVVYGFVGDFGLAIILFTILVKICMWPLIKRQLHQTRLMRKIQPELAEIKKRCNGNRQLESLQMMDLYKRNNIKPFRSILTLIIQLPIFIALYTAVRVMVLPTTTDNLSLRAYPVIRDLDNIKDVINKQEDYLAAVSDWNMQSDEDKTEENLPIYNFHPKLFGLVDLDPRPGFTSVSSVILLFFALASAFTQYWVSRQQLPSKKSNKSRTFRQIVQEATESGKEPDQAELNAIMTRQMSKITPIMMLMIMFNLPGALVFYYLISNAMTVFQQKYIFNKDQGEMEEVADKKIIKDLKKIEEAEIVNEKPVKNRISRGGQDGTSTNVTRISAKSKHGRGKAKKRSRNE